MKYNKAFFDQPLDRHATACVKWDALEKTMGKPMNPMHVADMDFCGPQEITDAMVRRAAHPVYGYTVQTESATQAMLDFMQRRHQVTLTAEQQTMLPCVISGLRAAVLTLTKPGDSVIVQPPVYGPFYASVKDNGRVTAECALKRDEKGYYTMDLEAVEEACKAGAKLMLLCNPHNPVGRAWKKEELLALIAILKRYDVALVSDEIHEDFALEKGCFTPVLNLEQSADARVIALTSVSKTFNLAGLQQAVAFCRNAGLLDAFRKTANDAGVKSGNIFGMIAAEAAYTHGDEWLDGMLDYIREGEKILRQELAQKLPKAIMSPLEATYLAWVDLHAYGMTSMQVVERCREVGVEFNPGTIFGQEAGEGMIRINLACQHDRIRLAAEQLAKAILG